MVSSDTIGTGSSEILVQFLAEEISRTTGGGNKSSGKSQYSATGREE